MLEIRLYNEDRDFSHIINSCTKENWTNFFTTGKERFRQALQKSDTYVAFLDDTYCGFMRCITDGFFTIYCCELIVDEAFRHKGIGTKLIRAESLKYPNCSIDLLCDNEEFYKANDFTIFCKGMRKRGQP